MGNIEIIGKSDFESFIVANARNDTFFKQHGGLYLK